MVIEPVFIAGILSLLGNWFRIYLIYQFLKVFFSLEGSKKRFALRCGMYTLFFIGNSMGFLYFQWDSEVMLISNLVGIFLITWTYIGKWKYRICATVSLVALGVICEDSIYVILMQLDIEHITTIGIALSNLLFLIVILTCKKISDFRHGEDVSFLEWIQVVLIPVISMVISAVALDECKGDIEVIIGGIGLLLLNLLFFHIFAHLTDMHKKQKQLLAVDVQNYAYRKQLDILKQSEDQVKAFRHDLNNHVLILKHLLDCNSDRDAKAYLNKMQTSIEPKEMFSSTGNELIDGLLNAKLGVAASELHAEIQYEVRIPSPFLFDEMDTGILIGNLMDNAIQALKKCTQGRNLYFFMEEKRGVLFIRIKNNHREPVREYGGTFITTKTDRNNHGIGLKNVKRIVEKYHGEMQIKYDQQWFSVKIMLFTKNE